MKIKKICLVAGFILSFYASVFSQNILNVGIGPCWLRNLKIEEKPTMWTASIEYGKMFDNVIGFGVDIDFTWMVYSEFRDIDSTVDGEAQTFSRKSLDKKRFMYPISIFLQIDPLSRFRLHPVVKAQIGLNMMSRYDKMYNATTGQDMEKFELKNGFYIGLIGKGSIDAVLDVGNHAAFFVGFEFIGGKMRSKLKGSENDYNRISFLGPGIRMGISLLF